MLRRTALSIFYSITKDIVWDWEHWLRSQGATAWFPAGWDKAWNLRSRVSDTHHEGICFSLLNWSQDSCHFTSRYLSLSLHPHGTNWLNKHNCFLHPPPKKEPRWKIFFSGTWLTLRNWALIPWEPSSSPFQHLSSLSVSTVWTWLWPFPSGLKLSTLVAQVGSRALLSISA